MPTTSQKIRTKDGLSSVASRPLAAANRSMLATVYGSVALIALIASAPTSAMSAGRVTLDQPGSGKITTAAVASVVAASPGLVSNDRMLVSRSDGVRATRLVEGKNLVSSRPLGASADDLTKTQSVFARLIPRGTLCMCW